MAGVFATQILNLHIETKFQDSVPSSVRASVLSVMTMLGRALAVPSLIGLGWAARAWGAFAMVQILALMLGALLAYWLLVGRRRLAVA